MSKTCRQRRTLRVFVYRNLNNNSFSVRDLRTGRVIAHADQLVLRNAVFKVSEAGRQRVLREQRKNVHAGVEGELVLYGSHRQMGRRVHYDPYRLGYFHTDDNQRVVVAPLVLFDHGKVYIA